jgi:hypothetical protein
MFLSLLYCMGLIMLNDAVVRYDGQSLSLIKMG